MERQPLLHVQIPPDGRPHLENDPIHGYHNLPYNTKASCVLDGIQIAIGALTVVLWAVYDNYNPDPEAEFYIGIWVGPLTIVVGVVCIVAAKWPNCGMPTILNSVEWQSRRKELQSSSKELQLGSSEWGPLMGLMVGLAMLSAAEFIVAVVTSGFTCLSCSSEFQRARGAVIVHPADGPPPYAHGQGELPHPPGRPGPAEVPPPYTSHIPEEEDHRPPGGSTIIAIVQTETPGGAAAGEDTQIEASVEEQYKPLLVEAIKILCEKTHP